MQYYICTSENVEGPFDLIAMVKKIKNGRVERGTPIANALDESPQPAGNIKDFEEFFLEVEEENEEATRQQRTYDLKPMIQSGLYFLRYSPITLVYTGMYLVLSILITIALLDFPKIGYLLAFFVNYVLFSTYQWFILKYSRGQTVSIRYVLQLTFSKILPLCIASAAITVLAGVGLILLIAPGLLVLTAYIFTPLLILEKGVDFWEAMEISRRTTLNMGSHNFGILLAIIVVNFLGAILLFFPLLLTLPVSMNALSEIYDDTFN